MSLFSSGGTLDNLGCGGSTISIFWNLDQALMWRVIGCILEVFSREQGFTYGSATRVEATMKVVVRKQNDGDGYLLPLSFKIPSFLESVDRAEPSSRGSCRRHFCVVVSVIICAPDLRRVELYLSS
ncbi:hypothetical protein L6164_010075 [Bauhinia variegata]|uniref:Uncharacterized protein n=1 Tax=Bauhinia variegata TaxID=167791 RepID=A0ACB9PLV7_BAUVA|nr:hypothetical protein L6164_010075 [Bauhinia variegata]